MSGNPGHSQVDDDLNTILSRLASSLIDLLPDTHSVQINMGKGTGGAGLVTIRMSWTEQTTQFNTYSKRLIISTEELKHRTTT